MNAAHSPQDFVRSLKAVSDPPLVGGLSKIEIAQRAWEDASFYVPSKAEVIVSWILAKFLKDKGKEIASNPIFDRRYWRLLLVITTPPGTHRKSTTDSRSIKTWLTPLLHRIPVGPVVVVFFNSFVRVHEEEEREQLSELTSSCLTILWPLAVQRMNGELLLECFGALLGFLFSNSLDAGFAKTGQLVVNSYRNSLNNSSNKKKIYQTFLQSHLYNWLHAVAKDFGIHESLKSCIVQAGIDTIFNLDILRQSQGGNTESALLQNLQSLNKTYEKLVLETLPQIYLHYIHSLKKHRGALFSQGSQHSGGTALDELHGAGVRFFVSCEGMLRGYDQTSQVWATRIALLQTVNQENLFHRKRPDIQVVLNHLLETSLTGLNDSWETTHFQTTTLALKCLSMLVRDDFDLVVPVLPRILVRMLPIPECHKDHFDFLATLLDYHTKTRTMNNFIDILFESVISERPSCPIRGRERYQVECSSPIMSTTYLNRLSKALHNSLTANQCLPTVKHVFGALKNLWEPYYVMSREQGDGTEGARKKRKTVATAMANDSNMKELAVTYCLVANLTSVVLSSLPIQLLPSDILEELRVCIVDFRTGFVHHTISKALKVLKKRGDIDAWSTEVLLASTLRLLYTLDTSKKPSLPPNDITDITKLFNKLADLSDNDDLLPELTLELLRALFCASSHDPQRVEDLMERLLKYLESHFCPADVYWSGEAHHLIKIESGRAECALAIMHMVFERWLPVIDHAASSQQLERFLNVVVAIDISPMTPSGRHLHPKQLFLQALHSAHFWELRNIRSVLLDILDKKIALDSTATDQLELPSILEKVATYRLLLFFPMEYFPGKNLSALIKRAMVIDDVLNTLPFSQNMAVPKALIVTRVFLKRAHLQGTLSITQDSSHEVSSCISNLLKEQDGMKPSIVKEFNRATLDLTEIYFSKLLKASKNGSKTLLDVLALYDRNAVDMPLSIRAQSLIEFIDLLVREFPADSLPADVTTVIQDLHLNLSSFLLPNIVLSSDRKIKDENVTQLIGLMSGWYRLLCLGGWLGSTTISEHIPLIGEKMVSRLISTGTGLQNEGMNDLKVLVFAIILQELGHRAETERLLHLDLIVSVYISFYDTVGSSGQKQLDVHFGKSCKGMALTNFTYLLSLVSDTLSDLRCLSTSQLIYLVHLSALLLREHPSHTLVHIQKFATRFINEFSGCDIFVHGPLQLRLQVLDLLVQHCSDQQAALRLMDVAGIWLFISKTLAPSRVHDQDTEVMIFHKIIIISSSLIRLRRDLVTSTLPHLGMVLRELLLSTRGCRPNLGAKQKTLVMNTQPQWINASRSLGAKEGKALGRLLESLNTKTTVRVLSSTTSDLQKAESLAKPFSKHAAYVLQAYVEAMNDSLCILSLEVRKELEPGLFALCGMMNEHSRDALMVSALDAGGKAILKVLWKEYEKQRYVGKG